MLVPYNASGAAAEPMADVIAGCKARGVWPFTHFNRVHVVPPLISPRRSCCRASTRSTTPSTRPTLTWSDPGGTVARVLTASLVRRTYYLLTAGNTLAGSFIWGINTLFLLDAGLRTSRRSPRTPSLPPVWSSSRCRPASSPTRGAAGVVPARHRDAGRRRPASTCCCGSSHAPFWAWAVVSVLLGLGFTFFSGAVEAWLVDALHATGSRAARGGFGRGPDRRRASRCSPARSRAAYIAQATNLGVPFLFRAAMLLRDVRRSPRSLMRDLGFTPERGETTLRGNAASSATSVQFGFGNRPVRWLMLAAPFTGGVGIYVFYALQPYLLELYGDPRAPTASPGSPPPSSPAPRSPAGSCRTDRPALPRRLTAYLLWRRWRARAGGARPRRAVLVGDRALVVWGCWSSAGMPLRQAYLNGLIPSQQRATVLSFDSLIASSGGVVIQPALGRVADVWGYPASFLVSSALSACALPFLVKARTDAPALTVQPA